MLLRGVRTKGMGFAHYLGNQNLPTKLERSEAEVLSDLRNQPTQKVKDEVILGFTRLGIQIAGRYVARLNRPDKADVLVSAACMALVEGVEKVAKGQMTHNNLGGYLVEQIHFAISAELQSEQQFGPSARTKRDRHQRGVQSETIRQEALSDELGTTNSEIGIFEIKEAFDSLGLSELESQIIELRVQGFRDDYIGEVVGLSQQSVWMIRRDIQTRYLGVTANEKASAK